MFGFNDALVSTTGVIVGVSTGTSNKSIVLLAGVVTILVEALSMGAGQYSASKAAHQLEKKAKSKVPLTSGIIMFWSYFAAGLVPLVPILAFPMSYSRNVAIVASLVGLFVLGYVKGKVVEVSPIKSAVEILIIGGIATSIGIIVGNLLAI